MGSERHDEPRSDNALAVAFGVHCNAAVVATPDHEFGVVALELAADRRARVDLAPETELQLCPRSGRDREPAAAAAGGAIMTGVLVGVSPSAGHGRAWASRSASRSCSKASRLRSPTTRPGLPWSSGRSPRPTDARSPWCEPTRGPAVRCDPSLLAWPKVIRGLELQISTLEIRIKLAETEDAKAQLLAQRRRLLRALEAAKSAKLLSEMHLRRKS